MSRHSIDLAYALTEAAKAIHSPRSVKEALQAIAMEAKRSIPGFDHVGISISHRDGKIETLAGTDPLVGELDDLQYSLDEGPCVDSVHSSPVVVVDHADREQRWPRFMPEAVKKGLRAQLALRLFTEEETLGSLNLYSTSEETVDIGTLEVAELFATHATIALGRARYEHHLSEALASRKVIGQAIGLIMQRYQIDEDRAFHLLVRASGSSNTELRVVAQEVVDVANDKFRFHGD